MPHANSSRLTIATIRQTVNDKLIGQFDNTLGAAAQRLCQGRCFAVLEGGYYLPDLGKNVLAFCEGLAGL